MNTKQKLKDAVAVVFIWLFALAILYAVVFKIILISRNGR
jgi:hypothetical protein